MGTRALEILLVLLLLVVGAGVYLQIKNQQLLDRILAKLQERPAAVALDTSPPASPSASAATEGAQRANTQKPTANGGPQVAIAPVTTNPTKPTSRNENPTPPPTDADDPTHIEPLGVEPPTPAAVDPAASESPRWQTVGPVIEGAITQLLGGKYDEVHGQLDPAMRVHLPRDELAAAIDPIRKQHGGLKRFVRHSVQRNADETSDTFKVDAELEDGYVLRFTVSIDHRQRISGLMLTEADETAG